MSSPNLTIDELMTKMREPLPIIEGYMEIIWDVDEPTFLELNDNFGEDPEFKQESLLLASEISTMVSNLIQKQTKPIKPSTSSDSYDLEFMSSEEILEKLRCKCKNFQSKYAAKREIILDSLVSLSTKESSRSTVQTDHIALKKIPGFCKEFMSVKDYAISFIDELLQEAEEKVNILPYSMSMETAVYYAEGVEIPLTPSEPTPPEILSTDLVSWVSHLLNEDFTPLSGRDLIIDIINNTWSLKKNWSFCIDFTNENSSTCADFYIYEVKWSLPTMNYPIPQVTASVYFSIEVSRVKPKNCPVNITYHFETERYIFTMDDDIQQEMFLDNIMKCKLNFFKARRM